MIRGKRRKGRSGRRRQPSLLAITFFLLVILAINIPERVGLVQAKKSKIGSFFESIKRAFQGKKKKAASMSSSTPSSSSDSTTTQAGGGSGIVAQFNTYTPAPSKSGSTSSSSSSTSSSNNNLGISSQSSLSSNINKLFSALGLPTPSLSQISNVDVQQIQKVSK